MFFLVQQQNIRRREIIFFYGQRASLLPCLSKSTFNYTIHHTADDSRLISAFELNLLLELVTEKEVIVERNCLQNYISCHCGGPDHLFAQGPSNLCEILITS